MGPDDEYDEEARELDELMNEFIRDAKAGYVGDPVDPERLRAFERSTRGWHPDDEAEPDD